MTIKLPTWVHCSQAIGRERASALERFIYEREPNGNDNTRERFRRQLIAALEECATTTPPDAEVLKDAARYRWLRDKSEPALCGFYLSCGLALKDIRVQPQTVDNYIDSAMEIAKAGKGEV